jgi:hypothetical protein
MDMQERRWSPGSLVVAAAIAVGVAAGSYGVASAASGSGSGSSSTTPSVTAPSAARPWGLQRSDETTLTGETAAKVRALALAKVSGGTIVRVETDADGNAAYEAHMIKADGTPVTVYLNQQFQVVSVQTGMPGPPAQSNGASA